MPSGVLAPSGVPVAGARPNLIRRVVRAHRGACTRVFARDDADGASSGSSRAQQIRDEKASALREELDGVRARSRRLLARGGRLVERVAELTAAAERAMDAKDRDEDEARRLLVERKKVREALDLTMARAEVLQQLASKLETAIIVLSASPSRRRERRRGHGRGRDAASSSPATPHPRHPPPRPPPRATRRRVPLARGESARAHAPHDARRGRCPRYRLVPHPDRRDGCPRRTSPPAADGTPRGGAPPSRRDNRRFVVVVVIVVVVVVFFLFTSSSPSTFPVMRCWTSTARASPPAGSNRDTSWRCDRVRR